MVLAVMKFENFGREVRLEVLEVVVQLWKRVGAHDATPV
jgi:hypothetical protein